MKYTRLLLAVLVVVFNALSARATLVEPPSFDTLVARADLVFAATVADVRSQWRETRSGRVIMSTVTFDVFQDLKGASSPHVVLEFFGGSVGKDMMRIQGMPTFARGDRDVLFVRRNATAGMPLVGLMHGRFRISRAPAGEEMVTTHDGRAIGDLAALHAPSRMRTGVVRGMTLSAFTTAIAARVSARAAAR